MPHRTLSFLSNQGGLVDDLSVKIFSNLEELSQNAAKFATEYINSLLAQQEIVSVVLATGNSQLQLLRCVLAGDLG